MSKKRKTVSGDLDEREWKRLKQECSKLEAKIAKYVSCMEESKVKLANTYVKLDQSKWQKKLDEKAQQSFHEKLGAKMWDHAVKCTEFEPNNWPWSAQNLTRIKQEKIDSLPLGVDEEKVKDIRHTSLNVHTDTKARLGMTRQQMMDCARKISDIEMEESWNTGHKTQVLRYDFECDDGLFNIAAERTIDSRVGVMDEYVCWDGENSGVPGFDLVLACLWLEDFNVKEFLSKEE